MEAVSTQHGTPESDSWPEGSVALWEDRYASMLAAASEAEYYESVTEMAGEADAVVYGRVVDVEQGRVIWRDEGVVLAFAKLTIEVAEDLVGTLSPDQKLVTVEVPFHPTSPELEAAIEAAIDREAAEHASTDEELAATTDDEAIAEAYRQHSEGALRYTVESIKVEGANAPSVFFLRLQPPLEELPEEARPQPGTFRFVNGSGLIANVDGTAHLPMRIHSPDDPIVTEVQDWTFDDVLDAGRDVRSG